MVTTSSCSNVNVGPQVFINFRGKDVRSNFIPQLRKALKGSGINSYMDTDMPRGQKLGNLFKRIEESKIALAILSKSYTDSQWCMDELVKIKECSTKGEGCENLIVIPIFYKLDTSIVRGLEGDFGVNLLNLWRTPGGVRDDRILKWDAALQDVLSRAALVFQESSEEKAFVAKIVTKVQDALTQTLSPSQENPKSPEVGGEEISKPPKFLNRASSSAESGQQRLKQLEEKLDVECNDDKTRILGLVGMAGIGKTYLADKLFVKLKTEIGRGLFITFGDEKTKEQELGSLQKTLVEGLLKKDYPNLSFAYGDTREVWKNLLIEKKVVVVFDNVSDKKQIESLLGNCDWIKKGSRIIITTRDKSLTEGLLDCGLYEVLGLNEREALELFKAQFSSNLEGNFIELSRKFLDYAGGNPLALEAFGEELRGKDEDLWEERLGTLTKVSNEKIRKVLRIWFDELNQKQKDAFLDIACFFRSQDESHVRGLLDSFDPESAEAEAVNVFRDLLDKFLISVSDGRVEMHDLLFTMAMELVETSGEKHWLFPSNVAGWSSDALKNKEGKEKVRGIILDMSKMEKRPLDNQAFIGMRSLRYLKVYYSQGEPECKLNLPDGIEFPKDNVVQYLDWIKFPGKELPADFEPKNLIDLRLPYSKIISIWNCAKVAPKLKWVDLSYSIKLRDILGLSNAPNLLRLDLKWCTSLTELPEEMQKMKSLAFLNLRGCTSLMSLPSITMDSLKTLILSGCSKLHTFKVISENLETLYLNGTAIAELPQAIGDLQRLNFLNLKDCKKLETLPDYLGKLKSLQELKLSGCSKLKMFPDVEQIMEKFRVLLLDGTSIKEMPRNIFDLSSLRRLCLSRNDKICSLEFDMGRMLHLKWLELKYCKNLTSLPSLPPNLQCLDAHGCTSLRTVTSPLALVLPTEQIHSILTFTNCHELEQVSKNAIISYVQKKTESMSHDRYNQDFIFKSLICTCFPGCEIPALFKHQALGEIINVELPQDWDEGRHIGIALCVVVSFKEYKDKTNCLQVKCTCEFDNVSFTPENFIVGGWSEPGDAPHRVESDHVFIGYTTRFNTKKLPQLSSVNEVSLRFEVTNGTSVVAECKVMKCGFSLVYEPDEVENTSWEATSRMEKRSSYTEDADDYPNDTNADASPTTAKYNRIDSLLKYLRRA